MNELTICPEDIIQVLLPADKIPDGATVTKRTGVQDYVLRHQLRVYREKPEDTLEIDGLFLLGPRGTVNQVKPDTMLHWHVTAEELVDELRRAWTGALQ